MLFQPSGSGTSGAVLNVVSISNADYTALTSDEVILMDTGATNRTVNLPSAATVNLKVYIIKKTDTGAGYVVVDPSGGEAIDDALTFTLTNQYDTLTIVSNGLTWLVI